MNLDEQVIAICQWYNSICKPTKHLGRAFEAAKESGLPPLTLHQLGDSWSIKYNGSDIAFNFTSLAEGICQAVVHYHNNKINWDTCTDFKLIREELSRRGYCFTALSEVFSVADAVNLFDCNTCLCKSDMGTWKVIRKNVVLGYADRYELAIFRAILRVTDKRS
jgi:hypothetical protein